MLRHQREKLLERTRRRVERAERQERTAKVTKAILTPSDRLKSARDERQGLSPQLTVAVEVLLLQGKSVKWVARDMGVSPDDVQAILARLAIAAATRKVDYIAARLSPAAPDPLPRLSEVAASNHLLPRRTCSGALRAPSSPEGDGAVNRAGIEDAHR